MKKTISFLLLIGLGYALFAQTKEEKIEAYEIAKEAIPLMDQGNPDKAIKMLKKSQKLDPDNYVYPYEIGYAYYLKKDAKNAIKTLKGVLKYEDNTDECYTLLGNIYDFEKKRKKAIETYQAGLEKFPESGRLYFEMGIVQENLKEYNAALNSWEKGIAVLPKYSSNYHTASIYFCKYTTEKIWGVLYGEMFINLERGSKKTEEISKLMYDTYISAINIESKTEAGVSFSKSMQMTLPKEGEEMKLPFSMPYELTMAFALTSVMEDKELGINSLHKIRSRFIQNWYEQKRNIEYPNILFDWHQKLMELDYFEAYNYWFFMKGNSEEFEAWYEQNQESFDAFITWFGENPLEIDKEHSFHRLQY